MYKRQVKATVVLAKGYAPSEELKKELQTHVKKGTAPYKYPRIVEFVEELPKTISGKMCIRDRLGAVAIPATHLLTTKDFAYRFDSATVKAVSYTHL